MGSSAIETRNSECDYILRFIMLGESGVGKTSFLFRYIDDEHHPSLTSTVGIDFRQKRVKEDGKNVCLNFWDTAGQERFRSVTRSFFRNCAGFLLLFDTTNKQSFFNVRCWLEQIKSSNEYEDVNVLLVGNKTDLVDERVVQQEEAEILARQFRLPYVETSVITGMNIAKAVHKLLEQALKAIDKAPAHLHGSVYKLVPSPGSDSLALGPIANGDKSLCFTCCNI